MNSDIPEIEKAHLQRLAMLLSLGVGFFMLASKMLADWITGSAAILSDGDYLDAARIREGL
jgi:divalent metal cation (Fe/Co/Zn/Cd) transporter